MWNVRTARRWTYTLAFRLARRCAVDGPPTPPDGTDATPLRGSASRRDALQGLGDAGERSSPLRCPPESAGDDGDGGA